MGKKVRIELDFQYFKDLLIFTEDQQDPELKELNRILNQKLNSMILRQEYTAYRTAEDPSDREDARRKYVNRKGLPPLA